MVEPFTDVQLRVLGSLAEKEATVPDTYPMTRNGLVSACNQKNNREPVTDLDDATVQRALDELKGRGVVRFVHPSHGARSTKFRHVLDEALRLSPSELSLLSVLALRGPQTVNELRVRTERAHTFADNDAVDATLEDLAARDDPLVVHLPRHTGQKETRWMHLLAGPVDVDTVFAASGEASPPDGPRSNHDRQPGDRQPGGLQARVADLEARVAALEAVFTDPTVLTDLAVSRDEPDMPPSGNDDFQSSGEAGSTEPRENPPS